MRTINRTLMLVGLMLLAPVASAHTFGAHGAGFAAGLVHPLIGFDHLLALIAVGLWGVMSNRRWVVNAAAVFGAIHFYTQWFEYLGPNPLSVLGGGILLIGFGFALRWFNTRFNKPTAA